MLNSFSQPITAVVIGASGGIGQALVQLLQADQNVAHIYACSRRQLVDENTKTTCLKIDITSESSIADCAEQIRVAMGVQCVFVVTGFLHQDGDHKDKDSSQKTSSGDKQTGSGQVHSIRPEKSWREFNADSMQHVFAINTIGPAMVAKHFLPKLSRQDKTVFAALSARVGSIEDNRLGGWAAYRSSKAALNMMIRTLSIELRRSKPNAICVALHPGTVNTALSKPFQANVKEGKLFTAEHSASSLLAVIDSLQPNDTGGFFAWDGQRIPY